jgi:hypothetical protein
MLEPASAQKIKAFDRASAEEKAQLLRDDGQEVRLANRSPWVCYQSPGV